MTRRHIWFDKYKARFLGDLGFLLLAERVAMGLSSRGVSLQVSPAQMMPDHGRDTCSGQVYFRPVPSGKAPTVMLLIQMIKTKDTVTTSAAAYEALDHCEMQTICDCEALTFGSRRHDIGYHVKTDEEERQLSPTRDGVCRPSAGHRVTWLVCRTRMEQGFAYSCAI